VPYQSRCASDREGAEYNFNNSQSETLEQTKYKYETKDRHRNHSRRGVLRGNTSEPAPWKTPPIRRFHLTSPEAASLRELAPAAQRDRNCLHANGTITQGVQLRDDSGARGATVCEYGLRKARQD